MSKRAWLILLVAFELTWCVYVFLFVPVFGGMLTGAPETQIREAIYRLAYVIPVVLAISGLTLAGALYDISRRQVSRKPMWILGFLFLGMIALPVYFALHVLPGPQPASV